MYTIQLNKAYCGAMAFERGTLQPGYISEPLTYNQNMLAAVTTKYTEGPENQEKALVCGGIDLLFQKWSTELGVLTNYEAGLSHVKSFNTQIPR